jgi:competence protein ComEA
MRKWLNTYFDFSKSEFNGLLILFGLIIIIALLPLTFPWFSGEERGVQVQMERSKLEWMERVHAVAKARVSKSRKRKPDAEPFVFDPNHLDVQGWQKLGLSLKQAQSVLNYVNKGGKFFKKEDVKKMYTINPDLYARLEPFIKIKEAAEAEHKPSYVKHPQKSLQIFDINTADTTELQEIRGVGPAFARRIARYRDRLGGFYKLGQLLEVYGFDSLKFEEIKGQVKLGNSVLRQININTAEFEDLKNHPYLKYKQANAIIQYRKQHGNYTSFADLKKVAILPAEMVDNIAPYLSF